MLSGRVAGPLELAQSPRCWIRGCRLAKKGTSRIIIHLACTECKERTYTTTKNKKNDPERLELKRYCPRCRTHRLHREVR